MHEVTEDQKKSAKKTVFWLVVTVLVIYAVFFLTTMANPR